MEKHVLSNDYTCGLTREIKRCFEERLSTAEEALTGIKKGSRVFLGSGCGEPQYLCRCLADMADRLFDVEIIQALAATAKFFHYERMTDHFRVKSFFVAGRSAREAVWEGRAEYIPMNMFRVPRLFSEKLIELDCALIQVSPPDAHGYMSLGIAVDVAKEAVFAADMVIAQVNEHMPVTLGDSFIHITDVDALVVYHEPLLEVSDPFITDVDGLIGRNIASLVEDGSTIHAGLGHLPKSALLAMSGKKDLGVHTDMLTDAYLELIRQGVITNRKKPVHPNRMVASYCLGSRELFDFVGMNPFVEFHPVSFTNDPFLIGRHDQMVSIHEAMEADLTGLLCSSSHENRVFSGIGGMVDFMRGVSQSRKGKFILALKSTSDDEKESRIVPSISDGAGLTVSPASVQYVVTEFGSVNLEAKSVNDRAVAMIEIAHPKFREELYSRARTEGLLSSGDPISLFKPVAYPHDLVISKELGGEELQFRPAKAADLRAIQEFFYGLDDRDIHFRFLRTMRAFPRQEMAAMANIDYHTRMTILVLIGEIGFERVVAIGRYQTVEQGELVEVDVAVAEDYRRRGLGRALVGYLLEIAKNKGYKGALASVAHDNPKTLQMIKSMGYKARATINLGVFDIVMRFDEPVDEPTMEIVYPDKK